MTRIPGEELKADGWEGKREVVAVVMVVEVVVEMVVVDGVVVVVVGAQVDTMENEQMEIRRKNSWAAGKKTILPPADRKEFKCNKKDMLRLVLLTNGGRGGRRVSGDQMNKLLPRGSKKGKNCLK